jgi:integrase/recombinase XerD
MQLKFREPMLLPKTIPLHIIENLLTTMYHHHRSAKTAIQKKHILRDIVVIGLLFATGMRISKLCYRLFVNNFGNPLSEQSVQIK